jgi:peptidoglycan/xylan/chitin deacetylase (PgdA/CDA1 family)
MALTWVKIGNLKGPKGDPGDTAAMNRFTAIETKNTEQDGRLTTIEGDALRNKTALTTEDLNTVTAIGAYARQSSSGTTGLNYPVASRGVLTVTPIPSGGVAQSYYASVPNQTFTREKFSGSWSAWSSAGAKNVEQDGRLDTLEGYNAGTRLTAVESKNTEQDGRLTAVESKNTTQDAALADRLPVWKANTAYTTGQRVISPDGDIVSAKTGFTSGASYDATNWNASAQDNRITQSTVWMGKIGTGGDLNTATGGKQRVSLYEIGDYGVGIANMPPGPYNGSVETISNFDGRRIVQRVTYNTSDPKQAATWERQGVDLNNNGVFTWTAWLRRTPAGTENKAIISRMTGWTAGPATNATFNLNDTSETMLGSNSVTMTTDGTGAATLSYVSVDVSKFSLVGRGLVIWLKVTNIDSINNLSIKVATSNAFTAAYAASLPVANGSGKSPLKNGELFPVYLSSANFYVNNGSPTLDNLTSIRISMGDKAGPPAPSVTIAGVASYEDKPRKFPRGVISICFDDTLVSHATIAAPKLANYGFPATEYTVYDTVGSGAQYLTLDQLRRLKEANGWEIAAHASTVAAHVDWSSQTRTWVENELAAQKAWQDANDFPTRTFAYPIGPFTSAIARQVEKQYDSARSTYGWTNSAAEPHKYRLSCYVVNAAYDPAWAQTIIDRMVERQAGWTIFMFHGLVESGATGNDTNRAAFNTIIDAIAASGIPVATVGDVIAASKV